MHNDISLQIGCQVAARCRCARAAGQGAARARPGCAYEVAPGGAAVQNVHVDDPDTSNVTFPMTVMGFVHLDDRGTTRCTLRAIPVATPPPPLTFARRGTYAYLASSQFGPTPASTTSG